MVLTGPFVTMIYKMIIGDMFRFVIIYFIMVAAFAQGKVFVWKFWLLFMLVIIYRTTE